MADATPSRPVAPFYDRAGRLITERAWVERLMDGAYCRVDVTRAVVRNDVVLVATVWAGWCLGAAEYATPMIFQTSVVGGVFHGAAWLYPTEAEARLGHQVAVELVKDGECDVGTLAARLRDLQAVRATG